MALHTSDKHVLWRSLGKDCRRFREAIPRGLREFAREARITHSTLCRAEHGKPLTVGSYFAVCMAYGLDPWDYIKQR